MELPDRHRVRIEPFEDEGDDDLIDKLFVRNPAMEALGDAKKFTELPSLQHGTSAFEVIMDYFLPALAALGIPVGEAAILAPTWFSLFPLWEKTPRGWRQHSRSRGTTLPA